MKEVKQYIIVREDLGMSPGKVAAQASHAAMKVFFDKMVKTHEWPHVYEMTLSEEEVIWKDGIFTKIVKRAKNEAELLKTYEKAKAAGLNVSLIEDIGLTELEGKNYTAIAVGPNYVEKCEPVVKRLRNL